jgi:hypothetical protein
MFFTTVSGTIVESSKFSMKLRHSRTCVIVAGKSPNYMELAMVTSSMGDVPFAICDYRRVFGGTSRPDETDEKSLGLRHQLIHY